MTLAKAQAIAAGLAMHHTGAAEGCRDTSGDRILSINSGQELVSHPLLQNSYGTKPQVVQDDVYPEGIVTFDCAAEARTLLLATANGFLVLLDQKGKQLRREKGFANLTHLAWAETGDFGIVALDGGKVVCLDRRLARLWEVELTGNVVGLAISPHGSHVAISVDSSQVHIVTTDKKEVGKFSTTRPLEFLQFAWERPVLLGAAEFGHLCCHTLSGEEEWNQNIMNNVGNMALTGDGKRILLSAFNHGVQVLNSEGQQKGSFVVDGIPDFVAIASSRRRLVTRTIEHRLYWLNFDGEISWGCDFVADPPAHLCVGPMGDRLFMSTQSGRLLQLVW